MNYPYYNNNQFYMQQDLQNMRDRIDQQLRQLQQPQQMQQQPTAINQTFQLAPNQGNTEIDAKYVAGIEEVKNTLALRTTIFVDKENKNLWIKSCDGNIKTYSLTEVIELDEKDKTIIQLQSEIERMKEMMNNGECDTNNDDESIKNAKSTSISTNKSVKK